MAIHMQYCLMHQQAKLLDLCIYSEFKILFRLFDWPDEIRILKPVYTNQAAGLYWCIKQYCESPSLLLLVYAVFSTITSPIPILLV